MVWGMKNYLIQLFGASTMEGRIGVEKASERWYELLRAKFCERYPNVCVSIYNGAVGGESLRERMGHLAADLAGHTPNLCLASFAWNNDDWEHPERVVPLQEQETLIQQFFKMLPSGVPVVGVIGQPLLDQYHVVNGNPAYDGIRRQYGSVNAFHDLERELDRRAFREHGCSFLDLSLLMADEPEKYILKTDGIHLSPAGHRLFANAMARLIQPLLDGL